MKTTMMMNSAEKVPRIMLMMMMTMDQNVANQQIFTTGLFCFFVNYWYYNNFVAGQGNSKYRKVRKKEIIACGNGQSEGETEERLGEIM